MPVTRPALLAAALLAGGCASVPGTISTPVAGPDVRQARADPDAHAGARVRWGGTIAKVDNLERRTVITVVARPMTRGGEPLDDEPAIGRFLAEANRFLEPEEYRAGRRITVVGRFVDTRASRIDQYLYRYPVVRVQDLYLWPEYVSRDPYYDWPGYWGPYYRPYGWPYYPYYGYPFRPWY